jgi:hypothetical protein
MQRPRRSDFNPGALRQSLNKKTRSPEHRCAKMRVSARALEGFADLCHPSGIFPRSLLREKRNRIPHRLGLWQGIEH